MRVYYFRSYWPSNLVFAIRCVTYVPNLRKIRQNPRSLSWTRQCWVSYFFKVTSYTYKLHLEKSNLFTGTCYIFSKVTCYSYCYILKVTSYFTSYFMDTLLHHLSLTIALRLNPSINPNFNLNQLNLGSWWNVQWYSAKIHIPLLHTLLTTSKITLLYIFNAAAHLGKWNLK